jgi:hypothetical protein
VNPSVDRINWKFGLVSDEVLKARERILESGRKKNERRKRIGASQRRIRKNHGDAKSRRIDFLRISVLPWFKI